MHRFLGLSRELWIQNFGKSWSRELERKGPCLYRDAGATLGDLREAVTTLEDTARIARRVLGGAHPFIVEIGSSLVQSRSVLRARETPP